MRQRSREHVDAPHREAADEPSDDAAPEELLSVDTAAYGEREAEAVAAEVARGVRLAEKRAQAAQANRDDARQTQRMGKLTREPGPRQRRESSSR